MAARSTYSGRRGSAPERCIAPPRRPLGDTVATRAITTGGLMVVESLDQHAPESLALTLIALGIFRSRVDFAPLDGVQGRTDGAFRQDDRQNRRIDRPLGGGGPNRGRRCRRSRRPDYDPSDRWRMVLCYQTPSMQDTIIGLMVDRFLGPNWRHDGARMANSPRHADDGRQPPATTTDTP